MPRRVATLLLACAALAICHGLKPALNRALLAARVRRNFLSFK